MTSSICAYSLARKRLAYVIGERPSSLWKPIEIPLQIECFDSKLPSRSAIRDWKPACYAIDVSHNSRQRITERPTFQSSARGRTWSDNAACLYSALFPHLTTHIEHMATYAMTSTSSEWLSDLDEKLRKGLDNHMGGVPAEDKASIRSIISSVHGMIRKGLEITISHMPGGKEDGSLVIDQLSLRPWETPPRFSVSIGCLSSGTTPPPLSVLQRLVTVSGTISGSMVAVERHEPDSDSPPAVTNDESVP